MKKAVAVWTSLALILLQSAPPSLAQFVNPFTGEVEEEPRDPAPERPATTPAAEAPPASTPPAAVEPAAVASAPSAPPAAAAAAPPTSSRARSPAAPPAPVAPPARMLALPEADAKSAKPTSFDAAAKLGKIGTSADTIFDGGTAGRVDAVALSGGRPEPRPSPDPSPSAREADRYALDNRGPLPVPGATPAGGATPAFPRAEADLLKRLAGSASYDSPGLRAAEALDRRKAVAELVALGPKGTPVLLEALRVSVARRAAGGPDEREFRSALFAILGALEKADDKTLKAGARANPRAIEALAASLGMADASGPYDAGRALALLARLGADAVPVLTKALSDPRLLAPQHRERAIAALAGLPEGAGLETLSRLLREGSPTVKAAVLSALASREDGPGLPLKELGAAARELLNSDEPALRLQAAAALSLLPQRAAKDSVGALAAALSVSADRETAEALLAALRRAGPAAKEAFKALLRSAPDPSGRGSLLTARSKGGANAARARAVAEFGAGEPLATAYLTSLIANRAENGADPALLKDAIAALRGYGPAGEQALTALARVILDPESGELAAEAADAVAAIAPDKPAAALAQAYLEARPPARAFLGRALRMASAGDMGGLTAVLVAGLRGRDPEIQLAAARQVKALGADGVTARGVLLAVVGGSSKSEQADALTDIAFDLRGQYGAKDIPSLIKLLSAQSPKAQTAALSLARDLTDLFGPAELAALTELAKRTQVEKRPRYQPSVNAVELIASLGERGRPAIPALASLLGEARVPRTADEETNSKDLRNAAAKALAALGPPRREDLPALIDLLASPRDGTRSAAAEALKAFGPGAAELLAERLASGPSQGAGTAQAILVGFGAQSMPALTSVLGRTAGAKRADLIFTLDRIGLSWPGARDAVPLLLADLLLNEPGPNNDGSPRTSAARILTRIVENDPRAATLLAVRTDELLAAALEPQRPGGSGRPMAAVQRLVVLVAPEQAAVQAASRLKDPTADRKEEALALIAELALAGKPVPGVSAEDLLAAIRPVEFPGRPSLKRSARQIAFGALALDALFPDRSEEAADAMGGLLKKLDYGTAPEILGALGRVKNGKERAADYLAQALKGTDVEHRRDKVLALIELGRGSERALTDLGSLLDHPIKDIRLLAYDELVRLLPGDSGAAALLLKTLDTADQELSLKALSALERAPLEAREALPLLARFLSADRNDPGMAAAVFGARELALKLAGPDDPLRPLFEGLDSRNEGTRQTAREALGALAPGGDPARAVVILIGGMTDIADPERSSFSARALSALIPLRPEAATFLARQADREANLEVRPASKALQRAGPAAIPVLAEQLRYSKNAHAIALALKAAGTGGLEAIAAFVADPKRPLYARLRAVDALDGDFVGLTHPESADRIARALTSALEAPLSTNDMQFVIRHLVLIGGKPGTAALEGLLSHADPKTRLAAAAALAASPEGAPRAEPVLLAAAASPDREERRAALRALGLAGSTAGAKLLSADDADELYFVLGTVAQTGRGPMRQEAIRLLVAILQGGDAGARTTAARHLRDVPDPGSQAVSALAAALRDPDPEVRQAAVSALGKVGLRSEEGARALTTALGDADRLVRRRAAEALGEMAKDDPWSVPDPAVAALASLFAPTAPRDSTLAETGVRALGALGARGISARPALRDLADSNEYGLGDAAREALRAQERSTQAPDPRSDRGEPTAELIAAAGAALGDPARFASAAGVLGGRGAEAREAIPVLRRAARRDGPGPLDPPEAALVRSAALKALADIDPAALAALASEAEPADGPRRPPSTAAAAEDAWRGARALARFVPLLDGLFPSPERSWRQEREARLAALKEGGQVRWYGPQSYTDSDGVLRRGYGAQLANGSYRFDAPDGFYSQLDPDASSETGNTKTGASIRVGRRFTTVVDPFTLSFTRRPNDESRPDVEWSRSQDDTGVEGVIHGRRFGRPAGEYPILKDDNALIFYRTGTDGTPVMTGWLERTWNEKGKVELHEYDSLGEGFGFVRDKGDPNKRAVLLTPAALQGVREGRGLAAIPDRFLPGGTRTDFEKALRLLPSMDAELAAGLRGETRMVDTKRGALLQRSKLENAELFYDREDKAYRLRINISQTLAGSDAPTAIQYVFVPSGRELTKVFVSREGAYPMIYSLDTTEGSEQVWEQKVQLKALKPEPGKTRILARQREGPETDRELADGRMTFVGTRMRNVVDGRWTDWRTTGDNEVPVSDPTLLDRGLGYLGTGTRVAFSPIQSAVYAFLAGSQSAIAEGTEALGYHDEAVLIDANALYTARQMDLLRWGAGGTEQEYAAYSLRLAQAGKNTKDRALLEGVASETFLERQKEVYGPAYFLYRPALEAQAGSKEAIALEASGIFGAANTPRTYFDEAKRLRRRGETGWAAANELAAVGFIGGEAYVTGAAAGWATTPLKLGLAGLTTSKGLSAVERALAIERNVAWLGYGEMAVMNAPGAINTTRAALKLEDASRRNDKEASLEAFHSLLENGAGFSGLLIGMGVSKLNAKVYGPHGLSAGESLRALKIKHAEARALAPEALLARVEGAFQKEWADTRRLPAAKLKAAERRLSDARDTLQSLAYADLKAARPPPTRAAPPADTPPAARPAELASVQGDFPRGSLANAEKVFDAIRGNMILQGVPYEVVIKLEFEPKTTDPSADVYRFIKGTDGKNDTIRIAVNDHGMTDLGRALHEGQHAVDVLTGRFSPEQFQKASDAARKLVESRGSIGEVEALAAYRGALPEISADITRWTMELGKQAGKVERVKARAAARYGPEGIPARIRNAIAAGEARLAGFKELLSGLRSQEAAGRAGAETMGRSRPEAFAEFVEQSRPVAKAEDFPGGNGAVEFLPKVPNALLTEKISPATLGYDNNLRQPQPYREAKTLADVPRAPVDEVADVAFVSGETSGSGAVVFLGKLQDGRAVAVKTMVPAPNPDGSPVSAEFIASWVLAEARSAELYSSLGVGPRFHGVYTDAQGRLGIVMDVARGDFKRTPVNDTTFADLELILSRTRAAGLKEIDDLQPYRTPEGRLTLIDPARAILKRGVEPEVPPDAPGGFATGKRLALLEEAPVEVGRRFLEALGESDPVAFKGLAAALGGTKGGWGEQRYGEQLGAWRKPAGMARAADIRAGELAKGEAGEILKRSPGLGLTSGEALLKEYRAGQDAPGAKKTSPEADVLLARGQDPRLPDLIAGLESASSRLRARLAETPPGPAQEQVRKAYWENQEHLGQLRLYRAHAEWVAAGAEVLGVIGRAEYLRRNPLGPNDIDNVPDAPHVYYRLSYDPANPAAFDLNRTAADQKGVIGNWFGVHTTRFARPLVNSEALAAPDVNTAQVWRRLTPVTAQNPTRDVMLRPVAPTNADGPDGLKRKPDGTVYGKASPGGRLEVVSGKGLPLPDGTPSVNKVFLDNSFTVRETASPGELPVKGSRSAAIRLSERITTELFEPSDPRLPKLERGSQEYRARYEGIRAEVEGLRRRLEAEAPEHAEAIGKSIAILEDQLRGVAPPPSSGFELASIKGAFERLFGRPAAPGAEAPPRPAPAEAVAARLRDVAGKELRGTERRTYVDIWVSPSGELLSVGAAPKEGVRGALLRIPADYREGRLVLHQPQEKAWGTQTPTARSLVAKAIDVFNDTSAIDSVFATVNAERAQRGRPLFTEADRSEMYELSKMMRDAALPKKPRVGRYFYDSVGEIPQQGIKLRVADFSPPRGASRADVTAGRQAILRAYLDTVRQMEFDGLNVDFKITLLMDAMEGTQAGKFVTIYTQDPRHAMLLADRLDRTFKERGMKAGSIPPEELPYGGTGMVSWRYGRQTYGKEVIVNRKGEAVPDNKSDMVANLLYVRDLPGMAPWLELARKDPRFAKDPRAARLRPPSETGQAALR
ncbi:MAG: HEAT repeat domain-containing protein [Elusimicrobia bacterium]|nr:HEAT repeat domain-containing protein [Elusimicrobiota bacterium]